MTDTATHQEIYDRLAGVVVKVDGVVEGDTAQVQTYIDACLEVKAKYPKPARDDK